MILHVFLELKRAQTRERGKTLCLFVNAMESDLIEIYIFPVASKISMMMLDILMMKSLY